MERVLKPVHELLEVRDASLECTEMIPLGIDSAWCCRSVSRLGRAADLADPGDQSLTLAHSSPPTHPLRRDRAGRVPAALFVGHLADHQRTARDLLAHQFELRLALLLSSLARRLHRVSSWRGEVETNWSARGSRHAFTVASTRPASPGR